MEVALTKRRNPSKIHVSEVFSMRKLRLRRKQTNKIPSEPYLPKNPGNRTLSPKNPPTPHPPTLYPVILSYIWPNPVNILVKRSVTDHFDSVSPMVSRHIVWTFYDQTKVHEPCVSRLTALIG